MQITNSEEPLPADSRIILYRFLRQFLFIVTIGLLVKFFLFDTIRIESALMAPALQRGDRILFFKGNTTPLLRYVFRLKRNNPVIFTHPGLNSRGCLRIAALDGDSIVITDGLFSNITGTGYVQRDRVPPTRLLEPEYSPRDNFKAWRIPPKGSTVHLGMMSRRDFFLCASMIFQEKPRNTYRVDARLLIDDSLSNDYIITGFPLYKGLFEAIPDSRRYDWFFWEKLEEHILFTNDGKKIKLAFSLEENGKTIWEYKVGRRFAFLLADQWINGYDSRYFGPICFSAIAGTPVAVLWSSGHDDSGKWSTRTNRIGRFIR